MGQRNKVLDTEGQTPKFLYAILKQLSLKEIDWNKVATDLEISNGHAARMRYSRFRSQMDGPSPRSIKRKAGKKAGKGDMKGEVPAPGAMPCPPLHDSGMVVKPEPTESPFPSNMTNALVKLEPGISTSHIMQGPADSQDPFHGQFSFISARPTTSPPRMMPPSYAQAITQAPCGPQTQPVSSGMPISIDSNLYSTFPTPNVPGFTAYTPLPMSHNHVMQDFSSQAPEFNTGPVITWEHASQEQHDSVPSPRKIKEESKFEEKVVESAVTQEGETPIGKACLG